MFAAFDDQRIWGAGETAEDALSDAEDRTDAPEGLRTAEMTLRLALTVEACGAERVSFYRLEDGRLGALEEWASQWDDGDEGLVGSIPPTGQWRTGRLLCAEKPNEPDKGGLNQSLSDSAPL